MITDNDNCKECKEEIDKLVKFIQRQRLILVRTKKELTEAIEQGAASTENVNLLVSGDPNLSAITAIGTPLLNGSNSNLFSVIGVASNGNIGALIGNIPNGYTLLSMIGSFAGSIDTLSELIGTPIKDSVASSLSAIIGGNALSSLTVRLGDPGSQTIDSLIGGPGFYSLSQKLANLRKNSSQSNIYAILGVSTATSIGNILGDPGTSDIFTIIGGDSSLITLVSRLGSPLKNSSSSSLSSIIGGTNAASLASRIGDPGTSDIFTIIGGDSSLITLVSRIGSPLKNSSSSSLSAIIGGTDTSSLADRIGDPLAYNIFDLIGGNATITDLVSRIGTTPRSLSDILGGNDASSLVSRFGDFGSSSVFAYIGGGTSTLSSRIGNPGTSSLFNLVGGSSTDLVSRIGVARKISADSSLSDVLGGDDSTSIASRLGDPGSDTIFTRMGGSSTSLTGRQDEIYTIISGVADYTSSINSKLGTTNTTISDVVSSLPSGQTSLAVNSITENSNVITINTTQGNFTYTYSSSINTDNSFVLSNGTYQLVLVNKTISPISSSAALLNYLTSLFPANSKISLNISDNLETCKTMVGGTAASLAVRISAIDRLIRINPSGVLNTDLSDVRQIITANLGSTLEKDVVDANVAISAEATINAGIVSVQNKLGYSGSIQARTVAARNELDGSILDPSVQTAILNIKTKIGGSSQTSVTDLIGNPTVSAGQSNLLSVIGSAETSVASALGDPTSGGTGLSTLIKNGTAVTNLNLANNSFDTSNTLYSQLEQFLVAVSKGSGGGTLNIPGGTYTSLAQLLNSLTLT